MGRLRASDESSPLEAAYGSNDAVFMIKNFGELMKEASMTNTEFFGDIYQMNCSITHDDMASFNVSSGCSCLFRFCCFTVRNLTAIL